MVAMAGINGSRKGSGDMGTAADVSFSAFTAKRFSPYRVNRDLSLQSCSAA